jgi:ABC-type sugar transport system permease subunit
MSWKQSKANMRKFVTDRAWQFVIGSLITLLGSIAIPIVFYVLQNKTKDSQPRQLVIEQVDHKKLTDFPNSVAGRTRILIDGKEEKDVDLFVFTFDYDSDQPARISDFALSITAKVPQNRKIIAAQNSLLSGILARPYRLDKTGNVSLTDQSPILVDIHLKDDHTAEITPLLLNPNDWFRVELYTSSYRIDDKSPQSQSSNNELSQTANEKIEWSCRIAGVQCGYGEASISRALARRERPYFSEPLEASIHAEGWEIYFLIVVTILNLGLILGLAKKTALAKLGCVLQSLLFAIVVTLSMITAGILTDLFWNSESLSDQPTYAKLFLLGDVIAFLLLAALISIRYVKKLAGSSRGEISPPD